MDKTFLLPSLQNGVLAIGDLWDCRTSQRLGFNLFANNLTKQNVLIDSGGESSSKFSIVKTTKESMLNLGFSAAISVAFMKGLIKVTGGMDFELIKSDNFRQEAMEWIVNSNASKIKLNAQNPEDIQLIVDTHVQKMLQTEGGLKATHVVTEITVGASAHGTLNLKQTNSNNTYSLGIFVETDIQYPPIPLIKLRVRLSAKVSDTVKESNYEMRIKLKSAPPLPPPMDVDDFSKIFSKMQEKMKSEIHYPPDWTYQEQPLVGIPKYFMLVPISRYIENLPDYNDFEDPDDAALEGYALMLMEIRDFEIPDFVKHKIIIKRPNTLKILTDPKHPITKEITVEEISTLGKIQEHKNKANVEFIKIISSTQKPVDWSRLARLVDQYKAENFSSKFDDIRECFIPILEDELKPIKVNEKDFDESAPLKFFTDPDVLTSWLSTDSTMKVLYKTNIHFEDNDGIQLRLYNMSIGLGKYGAESGISYPSLADTNPPPPLEIKSRNFRKEFQVGAEALHAISVLEAAVGQTSRQSSTSPKIFSVFAELFGIPLPLVDGLEHLIPLMDFLKGKTDGTTILNSENDTLADMKNGKDEEEYQYKFVVCVDSLHTITDNLHHLEFLTLLHKKSKVILGTFWDSESDKLEKSGNDLNFVEKGNKNFNDLKNISNNFEILERKSDKLEAIQNESDDLRLNSPNVYICSGGKLKAICLDHLDVLVLSAIFKKIDDHDILLPENAAKNCLSPARLDYARWVAHKMDTKIPQENKEQHSKIFPANPSLELQRALHMCTALLAEGGTDAGVALIRSLTRAIKSSPDDHDGELAEFMGSIPLAYRPDSLKLDDVEGWMVLKSILELYFDRKEPFLEILKRVSTNLEMLYEYVEEEEVEIGPFQDVWEKEREGVISMLEEVTNHPDCSGQVIDAVAKYIEFTIHPMALARLAFVIFRKEMEHLINTGLVGHKLLNNLIQLVTEICDNESISTWTEEDTLVEYVTAAQPHVTDDHYPDAWRQIQSYIKGKTRFSLLRTLAAVSMHSHLFVMHREFERMSGAKDWVGLIRLIERMSEAEFKDDALEYVWGNPKFAYLMKENSSNSFVIDALIRFQCKPRVPDYIPEDIRFKLIVAIQAGRQDFEWQQNWKDIEAAMDVLQIFYVRDKIPLEFSSALLKNLLGNSKLRDDLMATVADPSKIYWNEKEQYFEEPWDMATIEMVVDAIDAKLMTKSNRTPKLSSTTVKRSSTQVIKMAAKDGRLLTRKNYLRLRKIDNSRQAALDSNSLVIRASEILKRCGSPIDALNGTFEFPRVVLTTLFINSADSPVLRQLFLHWNKFPIAIPLVVQEMAGNVNAFKRTENFISTLPVLLDLPNHSKTPTNMAGIFESGTRFKFVVVLRIGEHYNTLQAGKSDTFNKLLMKDPKAFNSGAASNALNGMVEFVQLSSRNCDPRLWNHPTFQDAQKSPIVLANLHGPALAPAQVPVLQYLAKMASAYIVFWMPQSWVELQARKIELANILGGRVDKIFDICLSPRPDVVHNVPVRLIIPAPVLEDRAMNFEKLTSCLVEALKCPAATFEYSKIADDAYHDILRQIDELVLPEADALLKLSRKCAATRKLLTLQTKIENSTSEIDQVLNNPIYAQLIKSACAVLVLPENEKNVAISQLNKGFLRMSNIATQLEVNLYDNYHSKFSTGGATAAAYDFYLMRKTRTQISNKELSFKHFLFEIGRISNLAPERLIPHLPADRSFPSVVAELIVQGQPLQIPASRAAFFHDHWFLEAMSHIDPTLRIFVLSIFGAHQNSRTTKLLNRLFGCCDTTIEYGRIQGTQMRLCFLDETLKEELEIDAFLVLDSEGICHLEESSGFGGESERSLVSVLLGVSDLTVMATHQNSPQSQHQQLADILGIALLSNARLDPKHIPNLVIVNLTTATKSKNKVSWDSRLENILKTLKDIMDNYPLEAGITSAFDQKYSCLTDSHEIIHNVQEDEKDHIFSHADIVAVYRHILKQLKLARPKAPRCIQEWVEYFKTTWTKLKQNPTPYPTNVDNIQKELDNLQIRTDLEDLQTHIDDSFQFHCRSNAELIFLEMAKIRRGQDYLDDLDLTPGTIKKNIQIAIAEKVENFFEDCKLGDDDDKPCASCEKATKVRKDMLSKYSSEEQADMISTNIKKYLGISRDTVRRHTAQMIAANEATPDFEELDPSILNIIEESFITNGSIQKETRLNLKQKLSTQLLVIPSKRRLATDVVQVHPNLNLPSTPIMEDFVKTEGAFIDGSYLNWEQGTWILLEIEKFNPRMLMMRNTKIFANGMLRELKAGVNNILKKFEDDPANGNKRLSHGFRQMAHFYSIGHLEKVLVKAEMEWSERYNPVTVLNNNQTLYMKRIDDSRRA